jgi:hypothetical protein
VSRGRFVTTMHSPEGQDFDDSLEDDGGWPLVVYTCP